MTYNQILESNKIKLQPIPDLSSLDQQHHQLEVNIVHKYSSLVMLIFQYIGATLLTRYARSRPGPLFFSSTAVVLAEIIKGILAIGFLWSEQQFKMQKFLNLLMQQIILDPVDNLKIFIPSILYVVQNNLYYFGITHLEAATFQVSCQLNILTAAIFSVLLLPNRHYTFIQWLALFILFLGVVLVQWEAQHLKISCDNSNSSDIFLIQTNLTSTYNGRISHSEREKAAKLSIPDSKITTLSHLPTNHSITIDAITYRSTRINHMKQHIDNSFMGLCSVILACTISGFAGVYFEKMLKSSNKSLWIRQTQLGGFSVPLSFFVMYLSEGVAVKTNGFYYGYDWAVWMCIALQCSGGLLVAVVMRYADNVLKGFSSSIAILITSAFSVFFLDERLGPFGVIGAILVGFAIILFSDLGSRLQKFMLTNS